MSSLPSPGVVCRGVYLNNRMEKRALLSEPPPTTTSIEVQQGGRPLLKEIQKIPKRVKKLIAKLPYQEVALSVFSFIFRLPSSEHCSHLFHG